MRLRHPKTIPWAEQWRLSATSHEAVYDWLYEWGFTPDDEAERLALADDLEKAARVLRAGEPHG